MAWMVASWAAESDLDDARFLDAAVAQGVDTRDPSLALLVCQRTAETQGYAVAKTIAVTALEDATTDPAYDELLLWTTWHEHAAESSLRTQAARVITHSRLARPEGRVNPNPFLPGQAAR